MESKLSKIFISVCVIHTYIKLVALLINRYTRSSSQFRKDWLPLDYRNTFHFNKCWSNCVLSWVNVFLFQWVCKYNL